MLEPIGDFVLVKLEPQHATTTLWIPDRGELARPATVLRSGVYDFQPGDRVIVAMRQAIQVGDDLLLPEGGVLAKLEPLQRP